MMLRLGDSHNSPLINLVDANAGLNNLHTNSYFGGSFTPPIYPVLILKPLKHKYNAPHKHHTARVIGQVHLPGSSQFVLKTKLRLRLTIPGDSWASKGETHLDEVREVTVFYMVENRRTVDKVDTLNMLRQQFPHYHLLTVKNTDMSRQVRDGKEFTILSFLEVLVDLASIRKHKLSLLLAE